MAETPATTTTAMTATHPRPWISVPISSPGAPPRTAAAPIRSTRSQYGPPVSIMTDSSPPIAGSSASSRRPVANPTAIGTHSASTARAIVRPRHRRLLGPHHLGEPLGHHVAQPVGHRRPCPADHSRSATDPHKIKG